MIRAKFAILVDHYHLTLPDIAALTDRSIDEVYFHARTKEGSIEIPLPAVEAPADVPETEGKLLADLALLRGNNLISDENYAACVAEVRRKFRGDAGPDPQP
jgi:hypothetical protein